MRQSYQHARSSSTAKSESLDILRKFVSAARSPVLLSSFGKESLALLFLVREAGIACDIAYFELGAISGKHAFARQTIEHFGLNVTYLSPNEVARISADSHSAIAYRIGLKNGDHLTIVGATFEEAAGSNMLCAVDAGLLRSQEGVSYSWDTVICGRRAVDIDATVGSLHWSDPCFTLSHGTQIVMPLLGWTDEQLSLFLIEQNIRWDALRYELVGSVLREREEKAASPDHLNCCMRCVDAPYAGRVECPKLGHEVTSFAGVQPVAYRTGKGVSPSVMF